MEDFNLDNLERKNIYKTPENLFEKVQENVLKNVSLEIKEEAKPAKIFKMNWAMGIAASFVAVFGMLWLVNSGDNNSTKIDSVVKAEIPHNADESKQAYATLKQDIISSEEVNTAQTETHQPQLLADNSTKKTNLPDINNTQSAKISVAKPQQTEEHINAYLDALPKGEVAELASNSVSDVYLDLYN